MAFRVCCSRYHAHRDVVRLLFVLDSFAVARAWWGREEWTRALMDYYFFRGVCAVSVFLGGACLASGDYADAYAFFRNRFGCDGLSTVVFVSMGNDLVLGTRPFCLAYDVVPSVVRALCWSRSLLSPSCRAVLVYGGSAEAWGYPALVAQSYDFLVRCVVSSVADVFDYVTTGASFLRGVHAVDSIGHLDERSVYRTGALLIHAAARPTEARSIARL